MVNNITGIHKVGLLRVIEAVRHLSNIHKIRRNLVIVFLILVAIVLYNIYHILTPFIISAVLVYILAPLVNIISNKDFSGKKIPRGLSVVIIYLLFSSILVVSSIFIFPMIYEEGRKIASEVPAQINSFKTDTLPTLIQTIQRQFDSFGLEVNLQEQFDKTIGSLLSSGQGHFEEVPKFVQKIVGGFFSTITYFIIIVIFTAFILIDLPKIKDALLKLTPNKYKNGLIELGNAVNRDLSGSIRGQLIICIVNGVLTTIGLLILNIKYAVTLGVIAAVFSMIPIFGTVFSLVPQIIVSFTQGWLAAVEVVLVVLIIHFIEANFLNPKIMGNSVELHPAIIMASIFIGEHLFGVPGMLLAVPVVAIVRSVLIFIYTRYFIDEEETTIIAKTND